MKKYHSVRLGKDAREALLAGIKQVFEPVSRTMGAAGKNASFYKYGEVVVTNDGVSVAREIIPKDPFQKIGADLVKQVAERTVAETGDGTTGSIVFSTNLIERAFELVLGGKNVMILRNELEKAKDNVVARIKEISRPVKSDSELMDIARISVEDEKIAEIVTSAVRKAGKYGSVLVEEGASYSIEKEEVQGYFWSKGYVSPYMVTNERGEATLENCAVIVTDRYMNTNRDLIRTLDELNKAGVKSVLIIADKVEGELLNTLILNKVKGLFTSVAVQRPGSLEELEDIAILVGATAVTKDKGIKDISSVHCGRAKRVIVRKDKTTIITDGTMALESRVKELQKLTEDDKDNELLRERLAKLSDGVVMLRVGAKTEAERKYLKDKVDDAVGAVRSSLEEGVVKGAGVALYEIGQDMSAKTDGEKILKEVMKTPYGQILKNAGIEPDGKFYDVMTGKEVKDLFKSGIIDPAKVIRCIVENSVSFAKNALTIDSIVVELTEQSVPELSVSGNGPLL